MTRRFLLNLIAVSCAVSAGIHAALVPAHLQAGGVEGVGFAVAAVLLLTAALAVVRGGRAQAAASGLLLGGLIAAYLVAGEGDALGAITQLVQVAGLAAAIGFCQYEGVVVTPRRGKEVSS